MELIAELGSLGATRVRSKETGRKESSAVGRSDRVGNEEAADGELGDGDSLGCFELLSEKDEV